MPDVDLCSMCEQAPASTVWGLPVCAECAEWLTELQGELEAMEAADPSLAEKGRRVEDAARKFFGDHDDAA